MKKLFPVVLLLISFLVNGQNQSQNHLIFGSPYSSLVSKICADNQGNVYVAGEFSKSLLMGSFRFKDTWGGFVAKLDEKNKLIWMQRIDVQVKGIELCENQLILLSQYSKSGVFCEESIHNNTNSFNTMIAGLDLNTGTPNWKLLLESNSDVYASDIVTSRDGDIYFTGSYQNELKVGDFRMDSKYSKNNYLGKVNSKGQIAWVTQISGGEDFITGVTTSALTIDTDGNLIVAGEITGTAWFDEMSLSSGTIQFEYGGTLSGTEVYVAIYNTMGKCIDVYPIITEADVSDIVFNNEKLFVCGYFKGSIHQDYEPGISRFGKHIFLKSGIGANGNLLETMFVSAFVRDSALWAFAPSGINHSRLLSLSVDNDENIYAGGFFYDQLDLPDGTQFKSTQETLSSNILMLHFTESGELLDAESADIDNSMKLSDISFGNTIVFGGQVTGIAKLNELSIESRGKHHNGFIFRFL